MNMEYEIDHKKNSFEIMTFFYLFLQAYIIGMICNTAH